MPGSSRKPLKEEFYVSVKITSWANFGPSGVYGSAHFIILIGFFKYLVKRLHLGKL